MVKTVEGSTTSSYFLGIGGNTHHTLKDNAVNEMFRNANLTGSQAVVNITYTTSTHFVWGIYVEKTVTAYGTVIEFTK